MVHILGGSAVWLTNTFVFGYSPVRVAMVMTVWHWCMETCHSFFQGIFRWLPTISTRDLFLIHGDIIIPYTTRPFCQTIQVSHQYFARLVQGPGNIGWCLDTLRMSRRGLKLAVVSYCGLRVSFLHSVGREHGLNSSVRSDANEFLSSIFCRYVVLYYVACLTSVVPNTNP